MTICRVREIFVFQITICIDRAPRSVEILNLFNTLLIIWIFSSRLFAVTKPEKLRKIRFRANKWEFYR
jgi:hypothetical protein